MGNDFGGCPAASAFVVHSVCHRVGSTPSEPGHLELAYVATVTYEGEVRWAADPAPHGSEETDQLVAMLDVMRQRTTCLPDQFDLCYRFPQRSRCSAVFVRRGGSVAWLWEPAADTDLRRRTPLFAITRRSVEGPPSVAVEQSVAGLTPAEQERWNDVLSAIPCRQSAAAVAGAAAAEEEAPSHDCRVCVAIADAPVVKTLPCNHENRICAECVKRVYKCLTCFRDITGYSVDGGAFVAVGPAPPPAPPQFAFDPAVRNQTIAALVQRLRNEQYTDFMIQYVLGEVDSIAMSQLEYSGGDTASAFAYAIAEPRLQEDLWWARKLGGWVRELDRMLETGRQQGHNNLITTAVYRHNLLPVVYDRLEQRLAAARATEDLIVTAEEVVVEELATAMALALAEAETEDDDDRTTPAQRGRCRVLPVLREVGLTFNRLLLAHPLVSATEVNPQHVQWLAIWWWPEYTHVHVCSAFGSPALGLLEVTWPFPMAKTPSRNTGTISEMIRWTLG